MKKRTGFVSNSSSSSFIVGYGAIRKNKKSDIENFSKNMVSIMVITKSEALKKSI